ncbi:MAG: hypothetical protein ACREQM_21730 [Candidatus Dormibacteraceae bacterium]
MPRVTFEIPSEMTETAVTHINELLGVAGLQVVDADEDVAIRLTDARCACGRQMREERRGPAGSWVRSCPLHGDDGGAA